MNLDSKPICAPGVVTREVGGETMLLDLDSGTYFGLDAIGGRIWTALEDGLSLREACDIIAGEYDVGRDVLEADVVGLAGELAARGLISD